MPAFILPGSTRTFSSGTTRVSRFNRPSRLESASKFRCQGARPCRRGVQTYDVWLYVSHWKIMAPKKAPMKMQMMM